MRKHLLQALRANIGILEANKRSISQYWYYSGKHDLMMKDMEENTAKFTFEEIVAVHYESSAAIFRCHGGTTTLLSSSKATTEVDTERKGELQALRVNINTLEADKRSIGQYWYFLGKFHLMDEDATKFTLEEIVEVRDDSLKAILYYQRDRS